MGTFGRRLETRQASSMDLLSKLCKNNHHLLVFVTWKYKNLSCFTLSLFLFLPFLLLKSSFQYIQIIHFLVCVMLHARYIPTFP